MRANVDNVITFYSTVLVCLASGITTKASRVFQPATSLQLPGTSYLPIFNSAFPKLSQHTVYINHATNNVLEDAGASAKSLTEQQMQASYLNLKPPLSTDFKSVLSDQRIQSVTNKQRSLKEIQSNRELVMTKMTESSRPSSIPRLKSEDLNYSNIPRRSSYQVVEEVDEYLTHDSKHSGLINRGQVDTASTYRNSQDVTAAIKALDHFLSRVLNDDSYNSELHPPPNPLLALVLSRYGRYVPGPRNPRTYAYMTVNNIHNSKPFGNYKVECDQVPTYVRR